jgi:hypothetical protein
MSDFHFTMYYRYLQQYWSNSAKKINKERKHVKLKGINAKSWALMHWGILFHLCIVCTWTNGFPFFLYSDPVNHQSSQLTPFQSQPVHATNCLASLPSWQPVSSQASQPTEEPVRPLYSQSAHWTASQTTEQPISPSAHWISTVSPSPLATISLF